MSDLNTSAHHTELAVDYAARAEKTAAMIERHDDGTPSPLIMKWRQMEKADRLRSSAAAKRAETLRAAGR